MTPEEYRSGKTRHPGRISKQGDRYRRMLQTHGARSVLCAAKVAEGTGREVCGCVAGYWMCRHAVTTTRRPMR
ncbi:MAG: transposase [Rhodoferax sp.]|nr:transposase [Rhodoferax sp.]